MPQSPLDASDGVLRIKVKSNGQALADAIGIVSVHVGLAVGGIPSARLVVADGDMAEGSWPAADGDGLAPGACITIDAGYGDAQALTLFEGLVTRVGVRIAGGSGGRLEVECRGHTVALTRGRRSTHYAGQTDSEIMAGIIGRHAGLTASVEPTGTRHDGLTQHDCSDWDFILARAAANGLDVIADDDHVRVQPRPRAGEPVLSVAWGVELMDLHAELDTGGAPAPARADTADVRGRMSFQGNALARPGALIELSGVGRRFSVEVFVRAVEHALSQGGWVTTVDFGPVPAGPAAQAARVPAAAGLQVGIVTEVDDPAGERRIRIRLPMRDADASPLWAAVAQFHASQGFGAWFVPEVGDEVVVGFFAHEPSQPVVLGSLYGSRRPPAHADRAPRDIKALVTRGGHRLEFDDAGQAVTVSTAAGNRVRLDDADRCVRLQDQQGNQVLLHPGGIGLETPGDLKIAAQGAVAIEAAGAVTVGSRSDLRLTGLNVACEGQAGFSGKGGVTAELSAAGQTTVKGGLVMIN